MLLPRKKPAALMICVYLAHLAPSILGRDVAPAGKILAIEHGRRTIYHSPQSPGFTCWTGAWTMPDGSLMVCFTQATGPLVGRPRAPREDQIRLDWPPGGDPRYDMTGLKLENVHLRSFDGGKTWKPASADAFRSPMNGVAGECETATARGTVIRGVWGFYLPHDRNLPRTGFLQRSEDGTRTWGKSEVLLDPRRYTAWPKRIRPLRDRRLIITGGLARVPAGSRTRAEYSRLFEPLLLVSGDEGRTWSQPLPVVPEADREHWGGEEFDAAELPGGDLLCVFRRPDPSNPGRESRWQAILRKQGRDWAPQIPRPAPFPHSGHPELLATREGIVLHLATTGIDWTDDAGRTWQRLNVPGTGYYPRSIQDSDGTIFVFGHVGGDDGYGAVDQSIVMDRFKIKRQ